MSYHTVVSTPLPTHTSYISLSNRKVQRRSHGYNWSHTQYNLYLLVLTTSWTSLNVINTELLITLWTELIGWLMIIVSTTCTYRGNDICTYNRDLTLYCINDPLISRHHITLLSTKGQWVFQFHHMIKRYIHGGVCIHQCDCRVTIFIQVHHVIQGMN